MWRLPVVVIAVLCLAVHTESFAINVDAHSKECFFEDVATGTPMALSFQVAEGGFLDIDVLITDPDDKILFNGERESDGKYTFTATADGTYRFCFSNEMSSMTPKLVVFSIVNGAANKRTPSQGDDSEHDKVYDMIEELGHALVAVKREQEMMEVRDRTHQSINESSHTRVLYWTVFEALLLVTMSIGQVFYINRFFEVRSTV
eukprot:m.21583 g.21583  ORF g.21583 m.21583 type:complete len:203 (+) comp6476_c0_seq1:91-699(+)